MSKRLFKTIYLAADTQEGSLVTSKEFAHWADALLAAVTDGRAEFKRDSDDYLAAYEGEKRIYSCGAFGSDDAAKNTVGRELAREVQSGRYTWIKIAVDADSFLVCGGGDDENELLDAVIYGRAAGYFLRNADADRAGVEGDE